MRRRTKKSRASGKGHGRKNNIRNVRSNVANPNPANNSATASELALLKHTLICGYRTFLLVSEGLQLKNKGGNYGVK